MGSTDICWWFVRNPRSNSPSLRPGEVIPMGFHRVFRMFSGGWPWDIFTINSLWDKKNDLNDLDPGRPVQMLSSEHPRVQTGRKNHEKSPEKNQIQVIFWQKMRPVIEKLEFLIVYDGTCKRPKIPYVGMLQPGVYGQHDIACFSLRAPLYLEDHPTTCKWLGSPPFIKHLGHLEREQPYLGDLLTIVINHLLNGMILQVVSFLGGVHNPNYQPAKTWFWKKCRKGL